MIQGQSAEQIIDQVMELADRTRFMVLAPVVRGRKGEYGKLLEELRSEGFTRVKIDGSVRLLEESIVLDKRYKHDIAVVVDRLVMRHDIRKRLADSIETAVARAEGLVEVEIVGPAPRRRTSRRPRRAPRALPAPRPPGGRSRPAPSPNPGRSSRSPSASRAPCMDPRWSSSSRGSSRSTRRTARASAAPDSARNSRSIRTSVVPDDRCRSRTVRSHRGPRRFDLDLLRADAACDRRSFRGRDARRRGAN